MKNMILPMNGGGGGKIFTKRKRFLYKLASVTERRCFRRGQFLPGKEDVEKIFQTDLLASFFKKRGWPRNTTAFPSRRGEKRKGKEKKRRRKIHPQREKFFLYIFPCHLSALFKKRERNVSRRNVSDPSRVSIIHRRIEFLKRHIRSFTASCLGHKRRQGRR